MTAEERRTDILQTIKEAKTPVSGATLAGKYHISRQIIVQDIAILRVSYPEIYATPRGYLYGQSSERIREQKAEKKVVYGEASDTIQRHADGNFVRTYHVQHTDEQIEDELNTFVDMGGKVIDVFVEHAVYGSIRADMSIGCRRHVQTFMENIKSGRSKPLKNLTSGVHYHTVQADSIETLDLIEQELRKKGYLVS